MINCKLINNTQPLHVSKHTEARYAVIATKFYIEKFEESMKENKEFVATFRLDPIVDQNLYTILKFHTPGISPTPGLLSLEYDMIEDFLKDWQILGVYDIFAESEEFAEPKSTAQLDIIDMENRIEREI